MATTKTGARITTERQQNTQNNGELQKMDNHKKAAELPERENTISVAAASNRTSPEGSPDPAQGDSFGKIAPPIQIPHFRYGRFSLSLQPLFTSATATFYFHYGFFLLVLRLQCTATTDFDLPGISR